MKTGSSALDRTGELRREISALLEDDPELSFAEVALRLPADWDDHRFFAIGPRHLEAALTGTAQILVEGEYDGVLEPDRHYLPAVPISPILGMSSPRRPSRRLSSRSRPGPTTTSASAGGTPTGGSPRRSTTALRDHGAVGLRRRTPALRIGRRLAVAEAELERLTALLAGAVVRASSRLRA